MLGAAALAEGNVTIAVQGMNDFNDNIQSMIVYGDKLLLSSWDTGSIRGTTPAAS